MLGSATGSGRSTGMMMRGEGKKQMQKPNARPLRLSIVEGLEKRSVLASASVEMLSRGRTVPSVPCRDFPAEPAGALL